MNTMYVANYNGEYLEQLPPLRDTLIRLTCAGNRLSTLPSPLPPNLTYLDCKSNFLTALPEIPAFLHTLICQGNILRTLPEIEHIGLLLLNCSKNYLSELPNLPASLIALYCEKNWLLAIPDLTAEMVHLNFSKNQVREFPFLLNDAGERIMPPGLTTLYCDFNRLTTIPYAIPPTLEDFSCRNNSLTALPVIPPNSHLLELYCDNNNIRFLPNLGEIPQLQRLSCRGNLLRTFFKQDNYTIPQSLISIECDWGKLDGDCINRLRALINAGQRFDPHTRNSILEIADRYEREQKTASAMRGNKLVPDLLTREHLVPTIVRPHLSSRRGGRTRNTRINKKSRKGRVKIVNTKTGRKMREMPRKNKLFTRKNKTI